MTQELQLLISSNSLPDTKVAIGLTIEKHEKKAAIAIAEKFYQDLISLLPATKGHDSSNMIIKESTELFFDDEVEQENEDDEDNYEDEDEDELDWDWSLDIEDDEEESRDFAK